MARQSNKTIRSEYNYIKLAQARENVSKSPLVLTADWPTKWREIFQPITEEATPLSTNNEPSKAL